MKAELASRPEPPRSQDHSPTHGQGGVGDDQLPVKERARLLLTIDLQDRYLATLDLIQRLRFGYPELSLLHVAPNCPSESAPGEPRRCQTPESDCLVQRGRNALLTATTRAAGKGIAATARLARGDAIERLLRSRNRETDIIAVDHDDYSLKIKGREPSILPGLIDAGHTSLLISKGFRPARREFVAVFATDHSPASERALEEFLRLHPSGIDSVVVVSLWRIDDAEALILGRNLAMLGGDAERWIQEHVEELTDRVVCRLQQAGYKARSVVKAGAPIEGLRKAMRSAHGDLLILGARGRGVQRLHPSLRYSPFGSVSRHFALHEGCPVLLLRTYEGEEATS